MRHWILAITLIAAPARAQDLVSVPGILDNGVSNLHAEGRTIWVGPHLNVSRDGGETWEATQADSLTGLKNSVYSIDVEGDVLWAGLGYRYNRTGSDGNTSSVNDIIGLLHSTDGGSSWTYVSHLPVPDSDPVTTGILDLPEDTLLTYGSVQLSTLAITVPSESAPWDIDYDPRTGDLWIAGQLAGIRKSEDQGRTWQRIVLPPDTTRFLSPELGLDFPFFVQPVGVAIDDFFGLNFQAFAVLVDESGTVWAGTAGGLNRSEDGGASWHHYTTQDGLAGSWVISIEEQRRPGQEPAVWATNWPSRGEGQGHGISVTRDSGQSFESALHGQRCFDFAFDGPRVYVACEGGLYISRDDGRTFVAVSDFSDPRQPEHTFRPGTEVFAVATTDDALWAGTGDGLFKSSDGGRTWRAFRTRVPLSPVGLSPAIPADLVPEVDTYAYPNPFSPAVDRLIRLRYNLESSSTVTIRVFDFGMNLVRTVLSESQDLGGREVSWDGTDDYGARLANGTYFYSVQTSHGTFWGKILILE